MTIPIDPSNPVVRLCVEGMELEMSGRIEDASNAFAMAWERSSDDFERCIAAHYLARHQKTAADALWWNQESLRRANACERERVREFYASLYLNLAKSHEGAGNREEAMRFYRLAGESVDILTTDGYGNMIRNGIARGLQRLGQ